VKKNRVLENNNHSKYEYVKLGELLKQVKRVVDLNSTTEYKLLGVKSYGLGAFHREVKKGNEIKAKFLWQLKEGDFVYSRLGASSGSFCLLSKDFENYFVSNEFPTFISNSHKFNPQYLNLILTSKRFYEKLKDFNTGSALKRFHEEKFLSLQIPLPSIKEQETLVVNYYSKIEQAKILEYKASDLEVEIEKYFFSVLGIDERKDFEIKKGLNLIEYANLSKWSLNHINKDVYDFESAKFKTERLKNLLTFFEGGKTPSKSRKDFWDGKIYWTSPKDFNGRISIDKAEDKITQLAVKEAGMKVYPKGIFLSVFRSGILQHSFPTAITEMETAINQDLKAYSLNEDVIDKKYYLYFVHTFKKYILSLASKKSVTVESINTEDFFEIQIPLPPLNIQKEISSKINQLREEIKHLKLLKVNSELNAINEFEKAIFS
jgi:type I restriction enzyme S subunit